ncbi:hypothetical protein [Paraburkholderia sp. BR13444]|uniref:hypothetical protein n=1 Tax=Paraburkholderia sp. BR13444 TaxID=3236997 RepID=UPI0034CF28F8
MKPKTTLREKLAQQTLEGRRAMVRRGELLPSCEFIERLGVSEKRLSRLLDDGSTFAIEVDGAPYYPALLAEPGHDHKRLQSICRILVPAPPESRLDFLSSPRGSLGDRRPLDMLNDDSDYKNLGSLAATWAAEWSRTVVTLYEGEHEVEPRDVEPLYRAVAEVDPRRPLWERASEALHTYGYEWPLGPYPEARAFTVFVERQAAGYSQTALEACMQILAQDYFIRIQIVFSLAPAREPKTAPVGKHRSVIDVAKKVVAYLRKP